MLAIFGARIPVPDGRRFFVLLSNFAKKCSSLKVSRYLRLSPAFFFHMIVFVLFAVPKQKIAIFCISSFALVVRMRFGLRDAFFHATSGEHIFRMLNGLLVSMLLATFERVHGAAFAQLERQRANAFGAVKTAGNRARAKIKQKITRAARLSTLRNDQKV